MSVASPNGRRANEVFINLDHFISGFLAILARRFPGPEHNIKPLGDGALLVAEIPETNNPRELSTLLSKVLGTIKKVETDFAKHCVEFAKRVGHSVAEAV